jgi:hypothetical protein
MELIICFLVEVGRLIELEPTRWDWRHLRFFNGDGGGLLLGFQGRLLDVVYGE